MYKVYIGGIGKETARLIDRLSTDMFLKIPQSVDLPIAFIQVLDKKLISDSLKAIYDLLSPNRHSSRLLTFLS